ncbi:hypothetical protein OG786_15700 [Streptomyces sp. NBC_00101]|uniref:hypothetical protein n=1 Tax=Streptomyces sp. NBC_00101 TaxID=2975651 RepID=UPI00324CFED7
MDTRDSFTVGAVVRLAENDPARPMALLSLGAAGTDTLQLRYDPAPRAWQLVLPASSPAGEDRVIASYRAGADTATRRGRPRRPRRHATLYADATPPDPRHT